MANRKFLIDGIIGLAQKLGANPNKFMGTKQNINFLGTGDKGMKGTTFSGKIDENFMDLGFTKNDLVKIIEQDAGYVTAGKLNDVQLNTMYNNLLKIDETFNPPPGPTNVIDLKTRTGNLNKEGLESLRTEQMSFTDKIGEGINTLKTKLKAPFNIKGNVSNTEKVERKASEQSFLRTGAADFSDSIQAEGARRAVMRQVMTNNPNFFNLPEETIEQIAAFKDLQKFGSDFHDPLILLRTIVKPTRKELDKIDDVIQQSPFDDIKTISNRVFEYLKVIRPDGFADGGRIGYRGGKSVKGIAGLLEGQFTKAEVVIERMKNTIKGNPDDKYVQETFPNMIKELEAKPELANNPNVWKMFSEDMPKNQRLVEHSDGSISFFRQTEFGPQNIKSSMDFAKKHDLTLKEASRILKMEPEDQILEITRIKATRNMAEGGRIGYRSGKSVKGIAELLKLTNKKFGKDTLKVADEIDRPASAKLKDEFQAFDKRRSEYGGPYSDDYYRKSLETEELVNVDELPIELLDTEALMVKYPGIPKKLAKLIGEDTNLQRKAEAIAAIEQAMALKGAGKSADETIAILKSESKTKMAKGGLARILEM